MADDEYDKRVLEAGIRMSMMTTGEVRTAFLLSVGDPRDLWASALANDLEQRGSVLHDLDSAHQHIA